MRGRAPEIYRDNIRPTAKHLLLNNTSCNHLVEMAICITCAVQRSLKLKPMQNCLSFSKMKDRIEDHPFCRLAQARSATSRSSKISYAFFPATRENWHSKRLMQCGVGHTANMLICSSPAANSQSRCGLPLRSPWQPHWPQKQHSL